MTLLTRTENPGTTGPGTMTATGADLALSMLGVPALDHDHGPATVLQELTAALARGSIRRPSPAQYATARGRCWRTS